MSTWFMNAPLLLSFVEIPPGLYVSCKVFSAKLVYLWLQCINFCVRLYIIHNSMGTHILKIKEYCNNNDNIQINSKSVGYFIIKSGCDETLIKPYLHYTGSYFWNKRYIAGVYNTGQLLINFMIQKSVNSNYSIYESNHHWNIAV